MYPGDLYAFLFSKGILKRVNNRILLYALKARGYNNHRNNYVSGETFFIKKILAPLKPRLCLDIGANVGRYTKELLEETNAQVISFEPLPPAFKQLQEKVSAFGDRSVLVNKGVGSENKHMTIHYNPDSTAHASFTEDINHVDYVTNEQKLEVEVVTLDTYCKENKVEEIDLIKIDAEGFEKEIFDGATEVLTKIRPKFIQIEFNWHQLLRDTSLKYFYDLLKDYDVYQLTYNNWEKRDPNHPLSNVYNFSNFIFVRQD